MAKQIFTKTPALVISEEGITDNISLTKPGLIGWEEISDCDLRKYRGYIQLLISLHDDSRIYAKANKLNQAMIKIGVKDTGASIIINTKMLDCDPKQLRDDILQHLGKVRLDEHLVL